MHAYSRITVPDTFTRNAAYSSIDSSDCERNQLTELGVADTTNSPRALGELSVPSAGDRRMQAATEIRQTRASQLQRQQTGIVRARQPIRATDSPAGSRGIASVCNCAVDAWLHPAVSVPNQIRRKSRALTAVQVVYTESSESKSKFRDKVLPQCISQDVHLCIAATKAHTLRATH